MATRRHIGLSIYTHLRRSASGRLAETSACCSRLWEPATLVRRRQFPALPIYMHVVAGKGGLDAFCAERRLRPKAVAEARQLRDQLVRRRVCVHWMAQASRGAEQEFSAEDDAVLGAHPEAVATPPPPTPLQLDTIRQVGTCGAAPRR